MFSCRKNIEVVFIESLQIYRKSPNRNSPHIWMLGNSGQLRWCPFFCKIFDSFFAPEKKKCETDFTTFSFVVNDGPFPSTCAFKWPLLAQAGRANEKKGKKSRTFTPKLLRESTLKMSPISVTYKKSGFSKSNLYFFFDIFAGSIITHGAPDTPNPAPASSLCPALISVRIFFQASHVTRPHKTGWGCFVKYVRKKALHWWKIPHPVPGSSDKINFRRCNAHILVA